MIALTCEIQTDFTFNYTIKGFGASGYLMSIDQLAIYWNRCGGGGGEESSCFPQQNESLVCISTPNDSISEQSGSFTYDSTQTFEALFFLVKSNEGMKINSNLNINISIFENISTKMKKIKNN